MRVYSATVWWSTEDVGVKMFSAVASHRGATTFFKVGGPIPWSRVLLPFYRKKIRQVYPVWCSRLHNHTLFIKKLCKKLGVRPNFGEVRTPDPPVVAPMSSRYKYTATCSNVTGRCINLAGTGVWRLHQLGRWFILVVRWFTCEVRGWIIWRSFVKL